MKFLPAALFVIAIAPMGAREDLSDPGGLRLLRQSSKTEPTTPQVRVRETFARLPLSFEANYGQTDGQVKFLARRTGYTVFLTPTEAVLALQGPTSLTQPHSDRGVGPVRVGERKGPVEQAIVRMKLVRGNPHVRMEGLDELPGKVNYFSGGDVKNWRRNIPTYLRVGYRGVYPGIDLLYYGSDGQLEHDFVVAPKASPAAIHLAFEGASLKVDNGGDLVGRFTGGEIRLRRPVLYQEVQGVRVPIRGGWRLTGARQAGFEVGDYDTAKPLVIDPVLSYSTFLGGGLDDTAQDIAVDNLGNAYVTGHTNSANFPTTAGALQSTIGGSADAFVVKLDSSGSTLVYSTYLGGGGSDAAFALGVDVLGNAYVAGGTGSADFPTTANAVFRTPVGDSDAFVTKLDASGSALVYSTYLGGTDVDSTGGIAVDAVGNAYVTGTTGSADFPTTAGAFQTGPSIGLSPHDPSRFDAFLTKLDATGSTLRYSTYLGGTSEDVGTDVAVDAVGNAYVTGITQSEDFPTTPAAFQGSGGGFSDSAFVTKFNSTGSTLAYSTYLEGSHHDFATGIAVDGLGNAYVTGGTQSADFPTTPGAFQTTLGGDADSFIAKVDPTGSALAYSTYLGGSGQDWGDDITADTIGNAYLVGSTRSTDLPITPGVFQAEFRGGLFDTFVAKLGPAGSALIYSTYLGGSGTDFGGGIAIDAAANAYVAGFTGSSDFPVTAAAFQTAFGGDRDGFVAKIADAVSTVGKVTGGGSIELRNGRGTFAVTAHRKTADGEITGNLQYVNHATGVRVRSVTITSLAIAGSAATIEGTCTTNDVPCTFVVTVTDNANAGTSDTFIIAVSSSPTEGGLLHGGNIQVH